MDGTIKVTTEELDNAAQNFENQGAIVKQTTTDMLSLAKSLANTWSGDASETYISQFNKLEDDMNAMIGMINEHVVDLIDMAEKYRTAENNNIDESNVLQTDIIS